MAIDRVEFHHTGCFRYPTRASFAGRRHQVHGYAEDGLEVGCAHALIAWRDSFEVVPEVPPQRVESFSSRRSGWECTEIVPAVDDLNPAVPASISVFTCSFPSEGLTVSLAAPIWQQQ